jgi:hypothetical protein
MPVRPDVQALIDSAAAHRRAVFWFCGILIIGGILFYVSQRKPGSPGGPGN